MQEVWLAVVKGLPRLREPGRFAPWLFTIARRAVMNRLREAYASPSSPSLSPSSPPRSSPSSPPPSSPSSPPPSSPSSPSPSPSSSPSPSPSPSSSPSPSRPSSSPSSGAALPGTPLPRASLSGAPSPGSAYDDISAVIDREVIAGALAALPPPEREVLLLFHLEDQPLDVCAQICGVPVGTIKSRLHRARRLLREELTREGYEA
ncbi:RNA polymerase sigma factor (sigma-70 family) [Paractinoplanes brasiliensis]|uniref:RNA polymerase sigma factor (Sigma-70 family) n=1 Tax=Paractinoplanes brasiliensis TaxID=52695 RepID=A0A4R6JT91_9ACTN|nr:RNA polymerase sigma factor (sigma-70 family) [Actinoplanes brasiliensis]